MTSRLLLSITTLLSLCMAFQTIAEEVPSNTLTTQEQDEGWQLLFDGQTLGGWRNFASDEPVANWYVKDGMLAMEPSTLGFIKMASHFLFGTVSGDLIYGEKKFTNFELKLEWKISAEGNSGIFYLVADEEHSSPSQTGMEMQVLDNEGHPDGKIITHRAGDLYDMISASPETVRPPGEWNDVMIRIQDNQVEHWLNGVKVVAYQRGGPDWEAMVAASKYADRPDFGKSSSGYIALQDHGDAVWYRNIKLRELGAD